MTGYVWDTTGPLHASRCDRVDVLIEATGHRDHLVPAAVADEAARQGHPIDPAQFGIIGLVSIQEILSLETWQRRCGTTPEGRHRGEAEVAAVAETRAIIGIIDDKKARGVARKHGLKVHGVLWAISRAVVEGRVPSANAYSGLCDQMLTTGIDWPFGPGGYSQWFSEHYADLA